MGFQLAQHPFDDVVLPVNVARLDMSIIAVGVVGGSMGQLFQLVPLPASDLLPTGVCGRP